MPNNSSVARSLVFVVVSLVVIVSSETVAEARREDAMIGQASTEELPQALALPAPFVCGTEWRGSTYAGHGTHDWNLDLNRVGDDLGSDRGQPILAQADGTVVWFKQTGYNNHAGTYIEVDYGDVSVRYLHLVEGSIPEELAEIGARVRTGETIGLLGATGRVSGPHLHLEYWDSAGYDDSAWYQLPRDNHLPVAFDGLAMVATPGHPSPIATSTNCADPEMPVDRVAQSLQGDRAIATAGFQRGRPLP